MADMTEEERRNAAFAHRGEVVEGSGASIEPRKLGQMVSLRFEPEVLMILREIAERRGMTVSDLLREGAGMVIANAEEPVRVTELRMSVAVAHPAPVAWSQANAPSGNANRTTTVFSYSE